MRTFKKRVLIRHFAIDCVGRVLEALIPHFFLYIGAITVLRAALFRLQLKEVAEFFCKFHTLLVQNTTSKRLLPFYFMQYQYIAFLYTFYRDISNIAVLLQCIGSLILLFQMECFFNYWILSSSYQKFKSAECMLRKLYLKTVIFSQLRNIMIHYKIVLDWRKINARFQTFTSKLYSWPQNWNY